MPSFSTKSRQKLGTCDRRIQKLFNKVVEDFDCTILVGHRGEDAQTAAFKAGKSKVQWPDSKHNAVPSLAVDVSPWPIPKGWGETRNEYEKFRYFAFYVLGIAKAMKINLRWGGDWDMDHDVTDQNFNDLVHFEVLNG